MEGSNELGTAAVLTDIHTPDLAYAGGPGSAGAGFLMLSKE